jgi:hypothetical protein
MVSPTDKLDLMSGTPNVGSKGANSLKLNESICTKDTMEINEKTTLSYRLMLKFASNNHHMLNHAEVVERLGQICIKE